MQRKYDALLFCITFNSNIRNMHYISRVRVKLGNRLRNYQVAKLELANKGHLRHHMKHCLKKIGKEKIVIID